MNSRSTGFNGDSSFLAIKLFISLLDSGKTCFIEEQAGTESFYISICGIVRIPKFVFNRGSLFLFEV